MDIGTTLSLLATLLVGLLLGALVGGLWVRARAAAPDDSARLALEARAADHAVVKEGLERLHDQMRDLEHHRVSWQSQLKQQVRRGAALHRRAAPRDLLVVDRAAQAAGARPLG